ncbi:hypothetical protein FRC18_000195 [Serendipita sp. 400]|nr:hypothetical protein FRC18_000195 [Serendipita sp. 400]
MSVPSTHQALALVEQGKVEIKTQPLPELDDDSVLVKIKAVALNPTDWKHIDFLLKPGQSVGCDFAGDIAAIGKNVTGWKVGDPVGGFVRGGFVVNDNGAFQEYVVTLPQLIWRKPASLPYEDAAPMGGIALSTAVYALHHSLELPYEPISNPEPILIWSGATGVGMYAIKLASLAGYKVITVASQRNWDLVKSLGASVVFDYKDPEVVQKIKDWVNTEGGGRRLTKALDTISENGSIETCIQILKGEQQATVITLLPVPKDIDSNDVNVKGILIYAALKPKNEVDFKMLTDWNERLPSYVEEGKLHKVVPLKRFQGFSKLPEAIDYVRQGKVSGEKLVVTFE